MLIYSYINTRENWKNSKLCENTPPFGRRVSTQFLVFPISTRVDITVYQHGKCFIFLKCNAVYPKICFRNCSHFSSRCGKIQNPLTSKYDTTPNFLSPTTICHLSTLNIVWSLFVDAHPPDKFLKKPCVQITLLYEDGSWVRVGQMLHCKVVTHNIFF